MLPPIAVILTDEKRKIIWVNEDFSHITGYSITEVIGKKPSILQGPRSEKSAIQRIRRGLEQLVPLKDEITNYRKNGEEYLCKLVIYPIFNEEQELIHFIAFEVDGDVVKDESDIPLLNLQDKYRSSSLKGLDEVKLYYSLKEMMSDKKMFLNPDLSLKEVADRLATNTKYLSQVVNHQAGTNFQHFLNTYRVEEVKSKILDTNYQHLTLFGIALQCGFKNKSTFYKVFKEIEGQTPKAYIKQMRSEVQHASK